MTRHVLTILFFILGFSGMAQVPIKKDKNLLEERKAILGRIQQEANRFGLSSAERQRLSQQYGFPLLISLDHQRTAVFQYMDEAGQPVYYTTFNLNAARTTGASSMQQGGGLDLDLTGKGMVAGIYDQTRPKANHREFGNRISQIDGSTEVLSNHATHVAGTILAAGLNANAKGMANEATGWAFNWDGDISKMIQNGYDPDLRPGGHLISNHSYGNLVGWYRDSNGNWAWAGNESISTREDYRFGFYTSKSQQIDDLAFSKPFYTIVWAAGNDRSDVGDGTKNPDGPEDSIGPEGVPKNNITIGAVSEVRDYRDPEDVVMSSFSSWGPIDDGRVKPDLVAMGVNVFSTGISNEGQQDSYTTMSGTSMAAPNATGSLFLLQELFSDRNAGRFMRSATLKGLAIHTAKEAGLSPGPDYRFGWGLLDVEAAARLIINENGSSDIIRELVLDNGQVYEVDFVSDGLSPIKATIAWTDPAGTPPAPAVDPQDLMLVNDLDIRIIDEDGVVYFPWSLDPRAGVNARAVNDRDNFRDNVEQILITEPVAKAYKIRISHKGTLKNNLQAVSLLFSAGVSDGQDETLYWIGGEGDWNSPDNWSLESNGPSAGMIPDSGTRVVFDQEESIPAKVTLSADAEVFSLNFFGNSLVDIDLNDKEVSVSSGFRVSNQITSIGNGSLIFRSERSGENIIDLRGTALEKVKINVSQGKWRLVTAETLDQLVVSDAQLTVDMPVLELARLDLQAGGALRGELREIVFRENITLRENSFLDAAMRFRFIGSNGRWSDFAKNPYAALVVEGQQLRIHQSGRFSNLEILSGEAVFEQPVTAVGVLKMRQGIILDLGDDNQIHVADHIIHEENSTGTTLVKASGKGVIRHEEYKKYCFQNIQVDNVDLMGQAVVNLGSDAQVSNGANWISMDCEEVLFPDFEANFTCEGSLVEFVNTTEGPAVRYEWVFGSLGGSTLENPSFVFPREGTYKVALTAFGSGESILYEKDIIIDANALKEPVIVINGTTLTSLVPAPQYQWFRNGVKIENATERSYQAEDEGSYQVAVVDLSCNRISGAVVISAIADELPTAALGYYIGPNPTSEILTVSINNGYTGKVDFEIYATDGSLLQVYEAYKNGQEFSRDIRLNVQPGLYVLLIKTEDLVLPHRIIRK